jgi:hypothetical protein
MTFSLSIFSYISGFFLLMFAAIISQYNIFQQQFSYFIEVNSN